MTRLDRLILAVGRLHQPKGAYLVNPAAAKAYDRGIEAALDVIVKFRDEERVKRSAGQRRRRRG